MRSGSNAATPIDTPTAGHSVSPPASPRRNPRSPTRTTSRRRGRSQGQDCARSRQRGSARSTRAPRWRAEQANRPAPPARIFACCLPRVTSPVPRLGNRRPLIGRYLLRFSQRLSLVLRSRLQRWMTDAAPVRNDPGAREQLTLGAGPRLHFKVGKRWFRPGVAYSRALDAPMRLRSYHIVQVDLPLSF